MEWIFLGVYSLIHQTLCRNGSTSSAGGNILDHFDALLVPFAPKDVFNPLPNGTRRIRGLVPSDAQLGVSRRSHSLDDLGLGSAPKSCSNLACHVQIFVRGHIYQGRSTIPAVKSNLKDVEMSSKGWGFPKLCRVPLIHPHVSITASQSFMPYPYARM